MPVFKQITDRLRRLFNVLRTPQDDHARALIGLRRLRVWLPMGFLLGALGVLVIPHLPLTDATRDALYGFTLLRGLIGLTVFCATIWLACLRTPSVGRALARLLIALKLGLVAVAIAVALEAIDPMPPGILVGIPVQMVFFGAIVFSARGAGERPWLDFAPLIAAILVFHCVDWTMGNLLSAGTVDEPAARAATLMASLFVLLAELKAIQAAIDRNVGRAPSTVRSAPRLQLATA